MDNDTAKISAQEIDHESPKEHVAPGLEKITDHLRSSASPHHQNEHATEGSVTEQKDTEDVEAEIEEPGPVKVPRSKRRGLFGRFAILAEVEEPKQYSRTTKWYITFVVALAAVAAPLGSTIIFRMASDESM